MLRMESKAVVSWADEVEKEEEKVAAATVATTTDGDKVCEKAKPKPKPNPFGSARPREVILQERGINWRKLDEEDLRTPPAYSGSVWARKKEKQLKENIPASAAPTLHRTQMIPQNRKDNRVAQQKLENMKTTSYGSEVVPWAPSQNLANHVSGGAVIFPLKYPPRGIPPNLRRLHSDNGRSHFQQRGPPLTAFEDGGILRKSAAWECRRVVGLSAFEKTCRKKMGGDGERECFSGNYQKRERNSGIDDNSLSHRKRR